jgi:hypothetical protein
MSENQQQAEAYLDRVVSNLARTPAGGRNPAGYRAGASLGERATLVDETAWLERLVAALMQAGLPEGEARTTVDNGIRAGKRDGATGGTGGTPPPPSSSSRRTDSSSSSTKPSASPGVFSVVVSPVEAEDWTCDGRRWATIRATTDGEPFEPTWAAMRDALRQVEPLPGAVSDSLDDRKKRLRVWSAGKWPSGSRAEGERPGALSALVFDLDSNPAASGATRGEPDLDLEVLSVALAAVAPGCAWLAHTTVKSAPGEWRWRVIVPLAVPVSEGEYSALVDLLRARALAEAERWLMFEADPTASRSPRRCWFVPAFRPEAASAYIGHAVAGRLLDGTGTLNAARVAAGLPALAALAMRLENDCAALRERAAVRADKERAKVAARADRLAPWHIGAVLHRMSSTAPELSRVAPLPGGWVDATITKLDDVDLSSRGDDHGWPRLARVLGGWTADTVTVLVGHTGRGKSSWAVQAAERASREGAPVLYASMEMSAEELAARLLALRSARAAWSAIKRGRYSPEAVQAAGARLVAEAPHLYLWAPRGEDRHVDALREMVRALAETTGRAPLVVLDYVQRLADPTAVERRIAVSGLSGHLRDLSRPGGLLSLSTRKPWPGASVLALSSVGRGHYESFLTVAALAGCDSLEGTGKESGELEYDAPVLLCMTTDKPSDDQGLERAGGRPALVRVVKNREGGGRDVYGFFDAPAGRFCEETTEQDATRRAAKKQASAASAAKKADKPTKPTNGGTYYSRGGDPE